MLGRGVSGGAASSRALTGAAGLARLRCVPRAAAVLGSGPLAAI